MGRLGLILLLCFQVSRVLNSNESFKIDGKFCVTVQVYEVPSGGCYHSVPDPVKHRLAKLGSIVQVKNTNDFTCLARCFVIADELIKSGRDSEKYRKIVKNGGQQRPAAQALLRKLKLTDREMTLDDLPLFAKVRLFLFFPWLTTGF